MRAFSSEWVKLSRPATLFGFGGTMIGFALLFTIMAFESAGGRNIDLDGSGSESFVTAAMLSLPEGSILVVTDMAVFLGIVALASSPPTSPASSARAPSGCCSGTRPRQGQGGRRGGVRQLASSAHCPPRFS
jgi:hypothetical protein